MKPVNIGGHSAYQNRVLSQLHKYYPDAVTSLPSSTWQILDKFWNLDLSLVDTLMQDRYSSFGPQPRLPSDMLRALLVSVEFKITSYTRFAADLKGNYLHAIISGFSVGDTPGVGTFYDFHKRLWLSADKNLSTAVHPPKEKPQKPKGKEEKAAPVEKVTVEDLFHKFEETPPSDMAPCTRLWEIFIDLNWKCGRPPVYKNDTTINKDGIPLCPKGFPMKQAAVEPKKGTDQIPLPQNHLQRRYPAMHL